MVFFFYIYDCQLRTSRDHLLNVPVIILCTNIKHTSLFNLLWHYEEVVVSVNVALPEILRLSIPMFDSPAIRVLIFELFIVVHLRSLCSTPWRAELIGLTPSGYP